jgi:hypothetical protein
MDRKLIRRYAEIDSYIEGTPTRFDSFVDIVKNISGDQDLSKIDIEFGHFDSYEPNIRIGYYTPETDKEYAARMKKEEKIRLRNLEHQEKKEELKRLNEAKEKQRLVDLIKKYPEAAKNALLPD